ncbi:MAG TPA: hypothetical protein PKL21_11890, partial [Anaerolineaceae bacterium]|nr:hypothetical protein [Anaerolineaceae bacterium]
PGEIGLPANHRFCQSPASAIRAQPEDCGWIFLSARNPFGNDKDNQNLQCEICLLTGENKTRSKIGSLHPSVVFQ